MQRFKITLLGLLSITILMGQTNFKKEMIESGEKQKNKTPEQFQSYTSDYAAFKRTKAWNVKKTGTTIFQNTADLDISIIGGRVRSSLVDTNNNIALVAPSGGGLWSFNPINGSPFTPINDFGSFASVTAIAQNPFNAHNILIATGDEFHYTEGNGLFESMDGGSTFNEKETTKPSENKDFKYIRTLKFSPNTVDVVYMIAYRKLYKSTDGGENWIKVFDTKDYSNKRIHTFDFLANNGIILSVDNIGLFSSASGNKDSFSLITKTIPASANADGTIDGIAVATHAADRSIAYALFTGTSGNDIYKTTDNGKNWSKLSSPSFYISQTWFCLTLGVHPTNPNIVVGGSVGWGYTTDGGTTWKDGAGLEVDFHDIHFHPSAPNHAYLGYDQGIGKVNFDKYVDQLVWNGSDYVREKQPEQLELGKKEGFNTSQIYFGDYFPETYGDAFIQGQQDGGCFAKVNNKESRILVGDGGSVFVNKQFPNKAFASTQKGRLKNTDNALQPSSRSYSATGDFYENHPNWITQFDGNNADGSQLYIASNTAIHRTTDNGTTFSSIANHDLTNVKVSVQNHKDPLVYAIGKSKTGQKQPVIKRIANAATSPVTTTKEIPLDYYVGSPDNISIDPNNKNSLYATFSSGDALKISSLNNTPVISSIRGNIPDVVFNKVIGVENQPDFLLAGTNIGLFYSEDGGNNWILSKKIPYTQVTDLKLRGSDNRLFVFTYGRGAWATTLALTNTAIRSNQNQIEVSLFPNPTKKFLTIKTATPALLSIILYDIKGEKVLNSDHLNNINIEHLPTGIYILHIIKNGGVIATEKVIIQ